MKILSDFDGVLTDLSEEASRVRELFESKVVQLSGDRNARRLIQECVERVTSEPHLHGWRSGGNRVTAFSNEDGFIFVNGLAACMDDAVKNGHELARVVFSLVKNRGTDSFADLAQACYQQMAAETESGQRSPMDSGAGRALKTLIEQGHCVVIVSNSGTDRIKSILSVSDVGGELDRPAPRIRIRGNAKKYVLGNGPENITSKFYCVAVDRPCYREILLEEKPDVVIGDVFSLDLSLPVFMASQGFESLKKGYLFLRRREYTPEWSIDIMRGFARGVKGGMLEHFDELIGLA